MRNAALKLGISTLLAITLALFTSAHASAIFDWQGDWGQWSLDANGRDLRGASLSIFACSAASSDCRMRMESESSTQRCGVTGKNDGIPMHISSDGSATAQVTNFDEKPEQCWLDLTLQNTSGTAQLHLQPRGPRCDDSCTSNGHIQPRDFPLHNRQAYPALSAPICFVDARDSRQAWCFDAKIQALDAQLQQLASRSGALRSDQLLYNKIKPAREAALKDCQGKSDVDACMLRELESRVAEFKQVTDLAQRQYDQHEALVAQPGDPKQAEAMITQLVGVYKKSFNNGDVNGGSYVSEDLLEIVRVARDAIYFHTQLWFFNGHVCELAGTARFTGAGTFLFNDISHAEGEPACHLQLKIDDKAIIFEDTNGACTAMNCGARGSFYDESFARKLRQPITDIDKLKNSTEYNSAVKAMETSKAPQVAPWR